MKYKVGDKIRTKHDDPWTSTSKGTRGVIVSVNPTAMYPYTTDILYGSQKAHAEFNEDEIELCSSSDEAYNRQVDNLEDSIDSYKDKSVCKHEWVVIGMGLYGDYINCKHCDMKKEDHVGEDNEIEEDEYDEFLKQFDPPF